VKWRWFILFIGVFFSLDAEPGEALIVPPLYEGRLGSDGVREYTVTAAEGELEFFSGISVPTMGYDGDYLGPTLHLRQGERVSIRVRNRLREATTVHWHGVYLPAEADGGPRQPIGPGETWIAEFTVKQPAASLWYHPHRMGTTAEQVYRGLAGVMIISDPSGSADLPAEYGVDDIPLVLQERRFGRDGSFRYEPRMPDIIHGYGGNVLLTNGGIEPVFQAETRLLRLRLLNGSNSSILRLNLPEGPEFIQIASDGGLLSEPVRMKNLVLSPGERAEVILDLREQQGRDVSLQAESSLGAVYTALLIRSGEKLRDNGKLPSRLASLPAPDIPRAAGRRTFVMSTMGSGGSLTINGRRMDLNRVDERVPAGAAEVWELSVAGMMMNTPHNFHVHGLQFRIIDINGTPPPPGLSGFKDTVLLWPGDRVRLLMEFGEYPGIYMYHCHLLEHEDAGMMGQYEVLD
jgi:FtsP/CotA-like multicopper oxidase with cupredoxin domain